MAQMAFRVGAVGLPYGLAFGHTIIGIKANVTKVFSVSSSGDTGLGIDMITSSPFTIDDSPLLTRLFNERIYFEIKGPALSTGGASVPIEFKVYGEDGDPAYELDKSVYVKGAAVGGWAVNSERLELIYPSNTRPREEGVGEKFAEMLGLVPKGTGHLGHEPNGIWEVTADNTWKYYYRFNHGGIVQWFYNLHDAKERYWHFDNGKGGWNIKRNSRLEIGWHTGDTETWPVPFMTNVSGEWKTPAGALHQMKATRVT